MTRLPKFLPIALILLTGQVNAATRFYLPSSGSAAVSPSFSLQAAWDETDNVDRIRLVTAKSGTTLSSKTEPKALTSAGTRQLVRQYVSDPLDAQVISGTAKGTIRVFESAANDNVDNISVKILVVSNDGSLLTGALLNLGEYVPANEWNSAGTLTARRVADGDSLTAVTVSAGDRLVIEIGYRNSAAGSSIQGTMNFGDSATQDLQENESDTSASNPWIEFSSDIAFQSVESAKYLTLAASGALSQERVFTPLDGMEATDGGPNGSYTLRVDELLKSLLPSSSAPLFSRSWDSDNSKILQPSDPASYWTLRQDMTTVNPTTFPGQISFVPEGATNSLLLAGNYVAHYLWENVSGLTAVSPDSGAVSLATSNTHYLRIEASDVGPRPAEADRLCFHVRRDGTHLGTLAGTFDGGTTAAPITDSPHGCFDADTFFTTGHVDLMNVGFFPVDATNSTTPVDLLRLTGDLTLDFARDPTDISLRSQMRTKNGKLEFSTDGTNFVTFMKLNNPRHLLVDKDGNGDFTSISAAVSQARTISSLSASVVVAIRAAATAYDECVDISGLRNVIITGVDGQPFLNHTGTAAPCDDALVSIAGCENTTSACEWLTIQNLRIDGIRLGDPAATSGPNAQYKGMTIRNNEFLSFAGQDAIGVTLTPCLPPGGDCEARVINNTFENPVVANQNLRVLAGAQGGELRVLVAGNSFDAEDCGTEDTNTKPFVMIENLGALHNRRRIDIFGNRFYCDVMVPEASFIYVRNGFGSLSVIGNEFGAFDRVVGTGTNCDDPGIICGFNWIKSDGGAAAESHAFLLNNVVRFHMSNMLGGDDRVTFVNFAESAASVTNEVWHLDGNDFLVHVQSGDFNLANVRDVRADADMAATSKIRIRNQEIRYGYDLTGASGTIEGWPMVSLSDTALSARGGLRIPTVMDGLFYRDSVERRVPLGDSAGNATGLACSACVDDTDVSATGITTRSKLPVAIVYDDETNTFTQPQAINRAGEDASLTLDNTNVGTQDSGKIKFIGGGVVNLAACVGANTFGNFEIYAGSDCTTESFRFFNNGGVGLKSFAVVDGDIALNKSGALVDGKDLDRMATTNQDLAGTQAGSCTFANAVSCSVSLPVTEGDANYLLILSCNGNKTFWWSGKSTTGFTINASASSSDTCDWRLIR